MPICLNVEELKPGMKLFQAVCNDYIVLLPPGKILEQRDVDALHRKYSDSAAREHRNPTDRRLPPAHTAKPDLTGLGCWPSPAST